MEAPVEGRIGEASATHTLPPGPASSRFAQAFQFYVRPLEFFARCAQSYGDWFTVRIPTFPAPLTFVSDPEAIREIFAADGTEVLESGSFAAPVMAPVIGKHAMLIIDGAMHRRHREIIMPYFARGQFAKFGAAIIELVDREIASWPLGTRFPIRQRMRNITLQVILSVVFGTDRDSPVLAADVIRKMFGRDPSPWIFLRWARVDLGPLTLWGQFLRARGEIYRSIAAEMARRRSEPGDTRGDVLGALMEARDETGAGLEEQELLDEVLTMILAGNDTTATALSWAIYYILSSQEVLSELRRELSTAGGDGGNSERIASLPYLDATVKEVLRIAPIFSFVMRRLTQPMRLAGRELPAGTIVVPCIYLVHHRTDIWDEPERFNPERFLDTRHPAHHFFPFGGGIRHCIGAALATYEMKLILARILSHVDLKLASGYSPRPVWLGNFLAPSKGMPVICTPPADDAEIHAAG